MATIVKHKKKVTEEKLNSPDHFRVQMHLEGEDKLLQAILYGFISDTSPDIAKRIRDDGNSPYIKRLKEHFRTAIDSNPKNEQQLSEWIMKNVEHDLIKKAIGLIEKVLSSSS